MTTYKKILSYLLLSIYVLSSAHGAIPHIYDSNHQHEEHSHDHHSDDHNEHKGNHLIQVSHGIFHSVFHIIETLSHCHNANDEPIAVELVNIGHIVYAPTIALSTKGLLIEYSPQCNSTEEKCKVTKLYLINSSLRGPPSIV